MPRKIMALLVAALFLIPMVAVADEPYAPLGPMAEPITLKVVHSYSLSSLADVSEGVTPENGLWNELILNDLNIKFDWMWTVDTEQWERKFQLSIASGDIPDILRLNEVQFRQFIEMGALRDLTDAYKTYSLKEMLAMDDSVGNLPTKQATVDGKLLGIPRFEDNYSSMYMLMYRKDWADALGIEAPKTIHDVMDMCVRFGTEDPNQDGIANTDGLAMQGDPFAGSFGSLSFFQSFGGYPQFWVTDENGEIVPGILMDGTYEGLKALRELYEKGGIATDFATLSGDNLNEDVISSQVGVFFGMWWNPAYPGPQNMDYDEKAEWTVMPLPGLTEGTYGKSICNENMVQYYNAVYTGAPKGAEEALVKLLNYHYCQLAPVDNAIWPQEELTDDPEILAQRDAAGKERLKAGRVWNWLPVQTWPSDINIQQANNAYNAWYYKDLSYLRTTSDKDWYDKTVAYQEGDTSRWTRGTTAGMWLSRTSPDGGIKTAVRMRDGGNVVYNAYYGPATEAEQQFKSSLKSMAQEYFVNFIMGNVAADSWEGFKSDWLAQGGQEWWDEVKVAYAELH